MQVLRTPRGSGSDWTGAQEQAQRLSAVVKEVASEASIASGCLSFVNGPLTHVEGGIESRGT